MNRKELQSTSVHKKKVIYSLVSSHLRRVYAQKSRVRNLRNCVNNLRAT